MINFVIFIKRQVNQIMAGGLSTLINKLNILFLHLRWVPMYFLVFPIVILIRLLSPIILIRWQGIHASRIGHFAGNLELYLCEKDHGINVPSQKHFDIFFLEHIPICNQQLFLMWKRVLRIWPRFIFYPIKILNKILPGGDIHEFSSSCEDRDIHNLYDKTSPHLFFTDDEEKQGFQGLLKLGISKDSKFVCLMVRDSSYLSKLHYHSYRDGNIQSYLLAAETLTKKGYYVLRMGASVHEKIKTKNPKIIDYATNGARSDFMDIFLGAKCEYCISTSTGFDAIPTIFRKPNIFITVPIGYIYTFSKNFLSITKHHISIKDGHELSLDEIFDHDVAYSLASKDYKENGVYLVDNTPEEIRDLVIEMDDRINGHWAYQDQLIQTKSKISFISNLKKDQKLIHGEIFSLFGTKFLEVNPSFISNNIRY